MAVTERDVQRVVDAMPVLEQRVAEIEKKASAMQIVNQATIQTMRKESTESCNNVVDQASAKFANIELQARELHDTAKAIVDGVGQEFQNIKSTIAMTMQDVEYAVAAISQRLSALEAHANKVATQDHVTFQTLNQGDRREALYNGEEQYRKQQHNGTEWNVDEEMPEKNDPKDVRGKIGPVARVEGRCCRLPGHAQCGNVQILARHRFEQRHARRFNNEEKVGYSRRQKCWETTCKCGGR